MKSLLYINCINIFFFHFFPEYFRIKCCFVVDIVIHLWHSHKPPLNFEWNLKQIIKSKKKCRRYSACAVTWSNDSRTRNLAVHDHQKQNDSWVSFDNHWSSYFVNTISYVGTLIVTNSCCNEPSLKWFAVYSFVTMWFQSVRFYRTKENIKNKTKDNQPQDLKFFHVYITAIILLETLILVTFTHTSCYWQSSIECRK